MSFLPLCLLLSWLCSSWRGWAPNAGLQTPSTPSTPSTREDCLNFGPATNSSFPSLRRQWSTQTIPPATLVLFAWTFERKGWTEKRNFKKGRMDGWINGWAGEIESGGGGGAFWLSVNWKKKKSCEMPAWMLNLQGFGWMDTLKDGGILGVLKALTWVREHYKKMVVKGKRKSGSIFLYSLRSKKNKPIEIKICRERCAIVQIVFWMLKRNFWVENHPKKLAHLAAFSQKKKKTHTHTYESQCILKVYLLFFLGKQSDPRIWIPDRRMYRQ